MNNLSERSIKILASMGLILTTMIWGFAFVVMKNSVDVIPPTVVKTQAHALRRGRAVNDNECDGSHQCMQEVIPNIPAKAVATVTITLRTMPHTDFDFFSINLLNLKD